MALPHLHGVVCGVWGSLGDGSLGVTFTGGGDANNKLRVETVDVGSQAEKAGLRAGDEVVGLNGLPVQTTLVHNIFQRMIQASKTSLSASLSPSFSLSFSPTHSFSPLFPSSHDDQHRSPAPHPPRSVKQGRS